MTLTGSLFVAVYCTARGGAISSSGVSFADTLEFPAGTPSMMALQWTLTQGSERGSIRCQASPTNGPDMGKFRPSGFVSGIARGQAYLVVEGDGPTFKVTPSQVTDATDAAAMSVSCDSPPTTAIDTWWVFGFNIAPQTFTYDNTDTTPRVVSCNITAAGSPAWIVPATLKFWFGTKVSRQTHVQKRYEASNQVQRSLCVCARACICCWCCAGYIQ